MITQNRFWPFFGILAGFLGVPKTIYFGCLCLYFDNFFARKTVGSRESLCDSLLVRRPPGGFRPINCHSSLSLSLSLSFSVSLSVFVRQFFSKTVHWNFLIFYNLVKHRGQKCSKRIFEKILISSNPL